MVGGAPALDPVGTPVALAEAGWPALPSSDFAASDLDESEAVEAELAPSDCVEAPSVLPVAPVADAVWLAAVVAAELAAVLAAGVVAVLPVEVLELLKELSRELITDTLERPIRTVPSLGVLMVTEPPGVADVLEAEVASEAVAGEADVGEVVVVDAVPVVDVEGPEVEETENPGTTLRLGVSRV